MDFPAPAVEQAMTYQQVIMRALACTRAASGAGAPVMSRMA